MITLYHGSNTVIDEIDLRLGMPDKDFGQGFYLTHLRHQAERMALSKCKRMSGQPTVTVYEFDDEEARRQKLRIVSTSSLPSGLCACSRRWEVLTFNRHPHARS